MSTIAQGPGRSDAVEQPIHELSALRDVKPPAALVARVMTQLAEPRSLSTWQWLRRPIPIEIKLSPLAIICIALGLGVLFVVIGANMR
jgi:hypothetical protein